MPSKDILREMLNVMDTSATGASENRIENIAMGIFDINDNIQYNMNVVETISYLLSEKGSDILAATSKVSGAELTLTLENSGEYESIVSSIEMKFAELTDTIREDMRKIEAISSLLSGVGVASAEEASPDALTLSEEIADFASSLLPEEEVADFASELLPEEEVADFASELPPEEEVADFASELPPEEETADFVPPPLPEEEEAFVPPPLPDDEADFVPPPLPPDEAEDLALPEESFASPPLTEDDAVTL